MVWSIDNITITKQYRREAELNSLYSCSCSPTWPSASVPFRRLSAHAPWHQGCFGGLEFHLFTGRILGQMTLVMVAWPGQLMHLNMCHTNTSSRAQIGITIKRVGGGGRVILGWAGDETPDLRRLYWELHAICPPVRLLCRPPTDGDQMKPVDFYSLQETLDSIRPHRQQIQTFIGPKNRGFDFSSVSGNYLMLSLLKKVLISFFFSFCFGSILQFQREGGRWMYLKNDSVHSESLLLRNYSQKT